MNLRTSVEVYEIVLVYVTIFLVKVTFSKAYVILLLSSRVVRVKMIESVDELILNVLVNL